MPALPPPSTLKLRGDRDPHPGNVDKKRKKRTKEEMDQLRKEAAATKKATAERKQAGLERAAMVEVRMEAEDHANDRDGNNPPPTKGKKVLRPRPQTAPAEQDTSAFSTLLRAVLTFSILQAMTGLSSILFLLAPAVTTTSRQTRMKTRTKTKLTTKMIVILTSRTMRILSRSLSPHAARTQRPRRDRCATLSPRPVPRFRLRMALAAGKPNEKSLHPGMLAIDSSSTARSLLMNAYKCRSHCPSCQEVQANTAWWFAERVRARKVV
ncbi:hypothetical protein K438DRAFT_1853989 [Mycena galopus ATCC 62051]|nr:hypothetical protein K438DRAFT_1853989 [Mycena galopus ATCC 62051]